MAALPTEIRSLDRRTLTGRGMAESIRLRTELSLGQTAPVCAYDICDRLGVSVRMVDINMEGMYERANRPNIYLSALRPVPRKHFNCAHELGHHLFGHGSTLDQLTNEQSVEDRDQPNEILVNAFAAFLLMPTLGLRDAFARRSLKPQTATPVQLFAVASNFNVGYQTLVTHLAYGVELISHLRAVELLKSSPKTIQQERLGFYTDGPLVVADIHWSAPTLDLEVDAHALLPANAWVDTAVLKPITTGKELRLFRAIAPGISRTAAPGTKWATYVRVSRKKYSGLAKYRHLEETNDE